MTTTNTLVKLLQDTANILQKTQINLRKCPKARLTKGYLESRLTAIEQYWNTFQAAHQELLKSTSVEQRIDLPYLVNEEYYIYEDLYFCLTGDIKDMLSSNPGNTPATVIEDKVKLPRIQPPVFSGIYEDWPTFQDLFESFIHNNSSLTDVVKLHFLKNSVCGEAQALLKNIQVTDSNYEEAWNTLKNRYGNKRIIVNAILKRLFSQKKIYAQTANQIKSLLDTTSECLSSIANLKISVDSWDPLIVHLVVMKLDTETHKDWEEYSFKKTPTDLPTWVDLKTFLETKFRTLEFVHSTTPAASSVSRQTSQKSFHTNIPAPSKTCIKCNEDHTLSHCKAFANLDVSERVNYVKTNNLCYNCLLGGHSVFRCRLSTSCQICRKRHHSLLHFAKTENSMTHLGQVDDDSGAEEQQNEDENITVATHFTSRRSTALLATALVPVRDEMGQVITLRALVDPGSQANFITERVVQLLKLPKKPIRGTVTGVGSTQTSIKSLVQCELLSKSDSKFNLMIEAYVLATRLTSELPSKNISDKHNTWHHLEGLDLADPSYYEPGRVDMLLGVDVYAQILKNNVIKGPPGSPCAQNTSLGWILFGDVSQNSSEDIIVMHHNINLDLMIKNMWELDTIEKPELTAEQKLCETIYANTTTRTENGRYVVKLPTKSEKLKSTEGETKEIALRRFEQLERKLEKNDHLKSEYTNVIEEYSTLKHMEEVPDSEIPNPSVYLPHFAIVRNDKDTSKVRPVFDASTKGTNNVSLNEELLAGPQLQEDLRSIIMRWRMKKICFVADIQKMYRQILVTKQDADLQRILWRKSAGDPIKEYRLLRVTFGTASAPYLAVKTLQRVAEDEGTSHPVAAKTINEDFYMDDLMSGQDNIEAINVAKNVANILKKGGFDLQKWSSNSTELLEQFRSNERNSNVNIELKLDGTIRALGISWSMGDDSFKYSLELPQVPQLITKRNILADTQKLFDPLGWLAPSIIQAKMLIQKLWLHRSSWDDEVESENKEEWLNIRDSFQHLKYVKIPRWLHTTEPRLSKTTIHGFSDSSTSAYAAVAYLRVETEVGEIQTSIIAAKARVAPVKPLSLPRLELCGATMLAQLLKQIRIAMRIPESQVYAWTDSTIVLSWLRGDPNRWQTFVRNRVVSIHDDIGDKWYHVTSQSNPADVASRGTPLQDLISHKLWWNGPEWLQTHDIPFNELDTSTDLEMRRNIQTNLKVQDGDFTIASKLEEFDDLQQLIRTVSYCKRFLTMKKIVPNPTLTTKELHNALIICIKSVQRLVFQDDIIRLQINKPVRHDSKLKALNPYLDSEQILRVGGRLKHANISKESKNPIILDNKNRLTYLLVADAHHKTLHSGQQLMMYYLRNTYWILRLKQSVRSYIHKCLICARQSATAKKQLMGDLPKERARAPARPFLNSGVDFAGPYQTLMSKGRGMKTTKSYIAIFVCMVTKAIHLELVGDMTSEAFIGAFNRFVSRRGRCAHLWSDQGRNFIGANKALADAFEEAKLDFSKDITDKLARDGTQWHYLPVYSPNFGGLWESGVKSMKFHLKRILNTHLTFEEFTTLLCQIEACLNSRPYIPIDDNDNDESLTPGHFLIGEAPITVPSPNFSNVKMNILTRWQFLQKLLNDFWHKWQHEVYRFTEFGWSHLFDLISGDVR